MELIESLINLGLNEKEAKVYLALLSLEKATAYTVAVRSGLKKPTAYVILDNLVSKSFVLKTPYKEKHMFLAKSPQECIALAKEKISTAEEILPELLAIQKKTEEKASVSYYEKIEGLKEIYRKLVKIMKTKPESERNFVAFYAHQKDTPQFLQKYWIELNEEYKENKIKRRYITSLHPSIKKYLEKEMIKNSGVELKALPERDYSSNISVEIFDSYVLIVSHRYIQGILIKNPDIADVMKQIFNLVWKLTKEEIKR
ncbi:MAG: helix-turn-helix domain-containing protein [Patescibacteria group bacterium]